MEQISLTLNMSSPSQEKEYTHSYFQCKYIHLYKRSHITEENLNIVLPISWKNIGGKIRDLKGMCCMYIFPANIVSYV